jgi:hypothetical protein
MMMLVGSVMWFTPLFALNGKGCKRRIAGCSPWIFAPVLIVRVWDGNYATRKANGMWWLEG